MTEDFLLRQAAAELLVIEQSYSKSVDPHAALSSSLWNWFSEYGRLASPPSLVLMSSMVGDHLAGKSDLSCAFFASAQTALKEKGE